MDDWLTDVLRKSSDAAWDPFIARHQRFILAIIRHYTRDHDDVMDVFALVCEALREDDLRRLRQYSNAAHYRARFTTWLATVVRNQTIDWFRHRDGRRRAPAPDLDLSPLGQLILEHVYLDGSSYTEAYELICSRHPPGPSFGEFLAELRVTHRILTQRRLRPGFARAGPAAARRPERGRHEPGPTRRWAAREQELGGEPIVAQHAGAGGDGFNEMPALHYRRLRVAMIEAERQAAVRLSDEGVIGASVLRRIERDLDLEAMLLRDSAGSDWERADSSRAAVRETTRLG